MGVATFLKSATQQQLYEQLRLGAAMQLNLSSRQAKCRWSAVGRT